MMNFSKIASLSSKTTVGFANQKRRFSKETESIQSITIETKEARQDTFGLSKKFEPATVIRSVLYMPVGSQNTILEQMPEFNNDK
jgi:hypothetical protein